MENPLLTRYALTLEYVGTSYVGWQKQSHRDLVTIQGEVERAIFAFCGQHVQVQCAGRTDAGVHAWAQKAHVDLAELKRAMKPHEILKAINAHLRPQPISLIDCAVVANDFHARFDAKDKLYVYRILNRKSVPAIEWDRMWHIKKPLNVKAMQEATQYLIGQHDFSSFRDAECQAKNPVRTLDRLDVSMRAYDAYGGVEITIEAQAQSFLHHMVRNLTGTLVRVGEGKCEAVAVAEILAAKDRTKAGVTAPACGLYLSHIIYN